MHLLLIFPKIESFIQILKFFRVVLHVFLLLHLQSQNNSKGKLLVGKIRYDFSCSGISSLSTEQIELNLFKYFSFMLLLFGQLAPNMLKGLSWLSSKKSQNELKFLEFMTLDTKMCIISFSQYTFLLGEKFPNVNLIFKLD